MSFSKQLGDRWLPFFRAGYSDGGGALLKRVVSTGIGYASSGRHDYVGVGASWARAPAGSGSDPNRDQYTIEPYYRLQLLKSLQLVPDVQYIRNPAYNPAVGSLWVVGLRMRAAF